MIGTLWRVGANAPWSPAFAGKPLPPELVQARTEQVQRGAQLFYNEGCLYCHAFADQGGQRGPSLTNVGDRLTREQITISILNGRRNMPAYGNTLTPDEVEDLIAFLQSRSQQNADTVPNPAAARVP